jgi:hypothetical protein
MRKWQKLKENETGVKAYEDIEKVAAKPFDSLHP